MNCELTGLPIIDKPEFFVVDPYGVGYCTCPTYRMAAYRCKVIMMKTGRRDLYVIQWS